MIINIDTREQKYYRFHKIKNAIPYRTKRTTLTTGDYLVVYGESQLKNGKQIDFALCAVVERKSLADFYGTIGHGRKRFQKELIRMEAYGFAAVVIEAEWSTILQPNKHLKHPTKFAPQAAAASVLAWAQRHGVHFIPCPGRAIAERITFRLLERWYKDMEEVHHANKVSTNS